MFFLGDSFNFARKGRRKGSKNKQKKQEQTSNYDYNNNKRNDVRLGLRGYGAALGTSREARGWIGLARKFV
jgi:hypothetical protein